jgi:hypothetical protein
VQFAAAAVPGRWPGDRGQSSNAQACGMQSQRPDRASSSRMALSQTLSQTSAGHSGCQFDHYGLPVAHDVMQILQVVLAAPPRIRKPMCMRRSNPMSAVVTALTDWR